MQGHVAINGEIMSAAEAKISVFDRNYLYGDGIIEVMLAVDGCIISVDEHLTRLFVSARHLHLPLSWTKAELREELETLAKLYPCCYLRLSVASGLGVGVARKTINPQKTIICLPHTPTAARQALRLCTMQRHSLTCAAKTPNYLASIIAIEAVRKNQQGDDILWLTPQGEVTEATTANVFFLKEESNKSVRVLTPALTGALLAGVTRKQVIKQLASKGYEIFERPINYEELVTFRSAFLTSSVQRIQAVVQIDACHYDTQHPLLLALSADTTQS